MGKTGISDHRWSSDNQKARIYRTELIWTTKRTAWACPTCI